MTWLLELLLVAGAVHFAVPLIYYFYLKAHLDKPWGLRLDHGYVPQTTIMIPTFEESALIEGRLENIRTQPFPKQKLDVLVIDSGSEDSTVQLVKEWAAKNPDLALKVIIEPHRMGKAHALNTGLSEVTGEVVVLTEADSQWGQDSLRKAVSYFSDDHVAAVTGIKEPLTIDPLGKAPLESAYRRYYNCVRVGESKIDSTPVFHGELAAFRTRLLKQIGGFRMDMGADDSHTAALLALRGFRSIAVPEAIIYELTPTSRLGYLEWKRRRAAHLVQHFRKLAGALSRARPALRRVFFVEFFLHVLNPWLLLAAAVAFPISILTDGLSFYHLAILATIAVVNLHRGIRQAFRMWVIEQLILAYASITGLFSTQLIWTKIEELRVKH